MSLRVLWDQYEAAYLLDACLRIEREEITRREAVKEASAALRERAKNNGLEIDELFRNENGISLMMSRMEYILSDGKNGLPGANACFIEVAEWRERDPEAFTALVEETKTQLEGKTEAKIQVQAAKTKQDLKTKKGVVDFTSIGNMAFTVPVSYRYRNHNAHSVSDWKSLYIDVMKHMAKDFPEVFAGSRSFSDSGNMDITDLKGSRAFKQPVWFRRGMYAETSLNTEDKLRRIRSMLSACGLTADSLVIRYYVDEEAKSQKEFGDLVKQNRTATHTIDWETLPDLNGTAPTEYKYKNHRYEEVSSWNALWLSLIKRIYAEYPNKFASAYRYGANSKIIIGSKSHAKKMAHPVEVAPGVYAESNMPADKVIHVIADILKRVKVNPEIVKIHYVAKNEATFWGKTKEMETSVWQAFLLNLQENYSADKAKSVLSNLTMLNVLGQKNGLLKTSVGLMEDVEEIGALQNAVMHSKQSGIHSKKTAYAIRESLEIYKNFLEERETEIARKAVEKDSPKDILSKEINVLKGREAFFVWLRDEQHLAEQTCRGYVSAIGSAEHFAKEHGFASNKLYTNDTAATKATAAELFENEEFIRYNKVQHNRIQAAIMKLLTFYGSEWNPRQKRRKVLDENIIGGENEISLNLASFSRILTEHFQKGFRLESNLDMKRLRIYYEELTGTALELDRDLIVSSIQDYGIVYDGKLYMPQTMLSEKIKEQILSFIESYFTEGRSTVYYEAIFKEFSNALLDQNIYNSEMLKAYLAYFVSNKYHIGRNCLSLETDTEITPIDEVRQYLKQNDGPIQVEELCKSLSHIPEDRIRSILGANVEFVRNSKGEYFHADSLSLTEKELANIVVIIENTIEKQKFISGNELFDAIKAKYPNTFEKNSAFSVIGWRDALKYKLRDSFSFVGNVISRAEKPLSMSDVFTEYGKMRKRFSIDELEKFADSIGTTIYFDSLYKNSIRISYQWFVSKESVSFPVRRTDAILDRLCPENYISIKEINEFAVFPDASTPWTEYLLEQYVSFFSEKFYLLHSNYNKNCAVGAIVKKTCPFSSFDELVTDILAKSGISLEKKEALDYLIDNGYIARRSYTNIEQLMINARAIRNKKEK